MLTPTHDVAQLEADFWRHEGMHMFSTLRQARGSRWWTTPSSQATVDRVAALDRARDRGLPRAGHPQARLVPRARSPRHARRRGRLCRRGEEVSSRSCTRSPPVRRRRGRLPSPPRGGASADIPAVLPGSRARGTRSRWRTRWRGGRRRDTEHSPAPPPGAGHPVRSVGDRLSGDPALHVHRYGMGGYGRSLWYVTSTSAAVASTRAGGAVLRAIAGGRRTIAAVDLVQKRRRGGDAGRDRCALVAVLATTTHGRRYAAATRAAVPSRRCTFDSVGGQRRPRIERKARRPRARAAAATDGASSVDAPPAASPRPHHRHGHLQQVDGRSRDRAQDLAGEPGTTIMVARPAVAHAVAVYVKRWIPDMTQMAHLDGQLTADIDARHRVLGWPRPTKCHTPIPMPT